MKKIIVTLVVVFSFSYCNAQWVTIPDANFVGYLKTWYPSCMNGNQMDTTCSGVVHPTSFYIYSYGISDLTGLQYFDSIGYLDCSYNSLTSLPSLHTLSLIHI